MATNALRDSVCAISGCGGKVVQMSSLFIHTLGGGKDKLDFGEFLECEVWRCTRCGNIQFYAGEKPIGVIRK